MAEDLTRFARVLRPHPDLEPLATRTQQAAKNHYEPEKLINQPNWDHDSGIDIDIWNGVLVWWQRDLIGTAARNSWL